MRTAVAVALLAVGAILLLWPAFVMLGPLGASMVGYHTVGLGMDYKAITLSLALACVGTLCVTSGVWMLVLKRSK